MGLIDRLRKLCRAERSSTRSSRTPAQDPYREPSHEEKIAQMATELPFSIWQVLRAYENLNQDEALARAVLRFCATTQMDIDGAVTLMQRHPALASAMIRDQTE